MLLTERGLEKDVGHFFELPLPRAVWDEMKIYQSADFMKFVEAHNTPSTIGF
jgi:hypothetical protein